MRLVLAAVCAALASAPALAAAGESAPSAALRPSASSEAYLATESSDVLPKWTPSATLLTAYGQSLRRETLTGGSSLHRRTDTHLLFAMGLFNWVELGLALPIVLHQSGARGSDSGPQPLATSAVGDLRAGIKGTILPTPARGFGLGLAFDVTAPTGDPGRFAGEGAVTYAPQILLQQRMVAGISAAMNLGYLARPDRRVEGLSIGDAVTYRLAIAAPLGRHDQFEALGELDGSISVKSGGRHPLVLRAGLRVRTRHGVVFSAYGGGAPVSGFGVPDVHAMLGIGFAPPHKVGRARAFDGAPRPTAAALAARHTSLRDLRATARAQVATSLDPNDPDGDGRLAAADLCPDVAEDVDQFEDDDGCPDLDNDRDGVRDVDDLCPVAPELINGFADWDGCPDVRHGNSGSTYASFDADTMLPAILFESQAEALGDDGLRSLQQLAQLVRLNPWIDAVTVEIRVQDSGDHAADRRLAAQRARVVLAELMTAGVDASRVVITEPAAVPGGHPERLRVAVGRPRAGAPETKPAPPTPAAVPGASVMAQGPPE